MLVIASRVGKVKRVFSRVPGRHSEQRAVSPSRVLLITRNLPPLLGGMERLNLHLALELGSHHPLAVCGPRGCSAYLPRFAGGVAEVPHRPLPLFLLACGIASIGKLLRFRPHLVIAGSGLTAPWAKVVSWITGAKSVVYLHGLDVVAPSRVYRAIWLPFIRRMELVLVNSNNTARLAEDENVPADRIRVLYPGTRIPERDSAAGRRFRERYSLCGRPLILCVGRLTPRKGVAEFVQHGLPTLLASVPDAILLIVGGEAQDAVLRTQESQAERIRGIAASLGVDNALRFINECDDETLSAAYWAADVHLFPVLKRSHDVEGFGMVAIEAAAHGLYTVAFRSGGVTDAIVEGITGETIAPGDYGSMVRALVSYLARPRDERAAARRIEAARNFSWDCFGKRLRSVVSDMTGHSGAV